MGNIVAETILQQLGGHQFIVMTGAKDFVADEKSLKFKLPRNASQANYCKITLTPYDLYYIEFIKYTSGRFSVKTGKYSEPKWNCTKVFDGIYASQLKTIFEQYTGLYTRL